jgi:DNA-binding transcriptional MerR regulator
MGALEQVTQMRRENKSDEEIISALRNQGVSPREINDALNHAQIKSAVSDIMGEDMQAPSPNGEEQYSDQNYDSYPQQPAQNQVYTPQPQQAYYPPQDYQQQGYGQQDYYPQQNNTDTIVDVASQVFEEKISEVSKKVDSNEEFKTLTKAKLEHMDERLKRMEAIIDRLQSAILEKIGAYGSNIESIKKEMSMMQDSFGKALGSVVDMAEKKSRSSEEHEERSEKTSRKKK